MREENVPGYYAIIPAHIRYCGDLKYPERLLYGEITSLLNKEGYCYATNRYFADLYGVITGTVSRWISNLEKYGFVKVVLIKDKNNQVVQRRIYITDNSCRNFVAATYEQNKQYPYEQKKQYPISRKAKENNINIRIDRLFNYIINNKGEIPKKEFQNENEYNEFCIILERLEMNYTKDLISIYTEDNIEKIKIIIFCIKELFSSSKNNLIAKLDRMRLIKIYDTCKKIELESIGKENEIRNFVEYYYASIIKDLEKSGRKGGINDKTL